VACDLNLFVEGEGLLSVRSSHVQISNITDTVLNRHVVPAGL